MICSFEDDTSYQGIKNEPNVPHGKLGPATKYKYN